MSRPIPRFKAKIKNGEIVPEDKGAYNLHLATLQGEDVAIVIKKWRGQRSKKQNRYLWGGVYRIISDVTGHTEDELHEFFKTKFLRKKVNVLGEDRTVVGSTTKLNTKEFTDYIEKIKRFVQSNFDIFVPEAEDIDLPTYF